MAKESKKLKEELALMDKLEQKQNKLDILWWVVKNCVSSQPVSEQMKSYVRQSLTLFSPFSLYTYTYSPGTKNLL